MFIIALDFDGTVVTHKYPDLGQPVPGAIPWLKRWVEAGAKLMLWTMRHDSEGDGPVLTAAVEYLTANGVELWAVNENPTQNWSDSHKQYANLYVDDSAAGCPLIQLPYDRCRPVVNWDIIGPMVMDRIKAANL